MATQNNLIQSVEYKQTEPRTLSYKNYKFLYGPQSIRVSEDSRMAEYRYLFSDGAEFAKARGVTKISISGVILAGPVPGTGTKEAQSRSFEIVRKLKELGNNTAGVLVLPGLGRFDAAYMTDWNFEETGEYAKEIQFSLEFVETKIIQGAARVQQSMIKTQDQVVDTEKSNVEYTIVRGDTLSAIAARFGVTLGTLKALNPTLFNAKHRNGNLIFPGEVVTIQKGSAKTELPLPPKGTLALGNLGTTTGGKLSSVKGTSTVPRDARLETFINNKGNEVRTKAKLVDQASFVVAGYPVQVVDVISKLPEYYRNLTAGDLLNVAQKTAQQALGTFTRKESTTLDKWIDEKNKRISDATKQITKVAKDTIFPAFQGIIGYPKDRKIYVDTLTPTKINESRNVVG